MRVVNYKALKEFEFLDYGNFSNVFKVKFYDEYFAYKEFKKLYDNVIIDNICEMTEVDFGEHYLTPFYMVEKELHWRFPGYLMYCPDDIEDLWMVVNNRLRYLKFAKLLVQNLHKEHKYIHGDVNPSNFFVNTDEDLVYLGDFDSTLKIGQEPETKFSFSNFTREYLKYYKFDEKIDVYNFNLTTLSVLLNKSEEEIFELLLTDNCDLLESNQDVKKLSKELLLLDTRKPYSGEYIVDYLDYDKYRY